MPVLPSHEDAPDPPPSATGTGAMIARRAFSGLAGACAWMAVSALAAQTTGKPRRLGFMRSGTPVRQESLLQALAELGYREGHNIAIDWRWVAATEHAQEAAAELVRSGVELIIAADTPVAHAAAKTTRTIPIVLAGVADPVGSGLVQGLARPGGNITGVSRNLPALAGKKLELLKQAAPAITRIAFLGSASDPATRLFVDNTRAAGKVLGVQIRAWLVRGAAEFDGAFSEMTRERIEGVVVQPLFAADYSVLAALALRHRLASVSDFRAFAAAGGLLSYGPSSFAVWQRVASHIDRILRGASPGALPIEEPLTFELVVNRKTAKALDLTIPGALLMRADEVIE